METGVYFKRGSVASEFGLTLGFIIYNDRSFREPDVYGEKITEEEYYSLHESLTKDPTLKKSSGLFNNEETWKK